MALEQTPGVIEVEQRAEIRDTYLNDYSLRVPAADVGPGGQPYVDASLAADTIVPLYADAVTIGRGTNLSTSAGVWLGLIGEAAGITARPAVGASGFVTITASSGGTFIQQGTELKERVKQTRYEVSTSYLYFDGDEVPVNGVDTGPSTNQSAGTVLQFTAPPPGCGQNATVAPQSDGSGLIGGRPADDDRVLRSLISDARANPPASGNDAQYQQQIRKTPALSVQQVFTYPAIRGPGTVAYVFTLNPSRPGGVRAPNSAQIAETQAWIVGQMPGDDSVFPCFLVEIQLRVLLRVTWTTGAATWADVTPWPPYVAADPVRVAVSPSPSLSLIRLFTGTPTTDPQVGQTIGFYDNVSGTFKRVRIGAISVVTPTTTWDITPDRTNNASDPSYVPAVGDVASPWSGSLSLVSPAVISYFDGFGPGEQVSSLPDPGLRRRRQPPSAQNSKWPSVVTNKILEPVFKVSAIFSASLVEPTDPYPTPVGVAASYSNLLILGQLGIYP